MLRIDLSKAAQKFIKKLPPKQARQVTAKIYGLAENPKPHDSEWLKGDLAAYRRADVGEHRIIYDVEEPHLRIALVGKRNDGVVYDTLRRKH